MSGNDAITPGFVEVDELEFRKIPSGAKGESAHPPEAIDANACFHFDCCLMDNSFAREIPIHEDESGAFNEAFWVTIPSHSRIGE
jgi:hypothetical protein